MAQKIVVLCDRHLEDGVEVEGQSWTFGASIESESPDLFAIDLCGDCAGKELLPAAQLVWDIGRPLRTASRHRRKATASPASPAATATDDRPRDHVCPVEGCGKAYTTRQGVALHVTRSHGAKLTEVEAAAGS